MQGEQILVSCECIESTAVDIQYFEQGRVYDVDMKWAKKRGIWGYFKPLEEIPVSRKRERKADEASDAATRKVS